ncbi:hypothetical protein [Thiomicrorhabdus arctica]|uniref:hypothetical protein n=1 Tax=Thiomicrorhabdus arctica TaxID=131540 RepID=UPI000369A2A1|nr:hypothetical protein [Thiomicrorhabdus arctica]
MISNEYIVASWLIIPIVTASITYYFNSRLKSKEELNTVLNQLEEDSTAFWTNNGVDNQSIIASIKIKQHLKKLESKLPSKHQSTLTKLRQATTGSDFESPSRISIEPTHEKFHITSELVDKLRP